MQIFCSIEITIGQQSETTLKLYSQTKKKKYNYLILVKKRKTVQFGNGGGIDTFRRFHRTVFEKWSTQNEKWGVYLRVLVVKARQDFSDETILLRNDNDIEGTWKRKVKD
uniref:Uncharacterized protein n=1 Tax=Romanomermis culicivorax TaxID=13658 RepID=A0A915I7D5_ROMCU